MPKLKMLGCRIHSHSCAEDTEVIVPKQFLPLSREKMPRSSGNHRLSQGYERNQLEWYAGFWHADISQWGQRSPKPSNFDDPKWRCVTGRRECAEGQRSIRIQAAMDRFSKAMGQASLPVVTARGGLFAFSRLMAATFPGAQTSILDQGTLSIDGKALHRITIEEPAFSAELLQALTKSVPLTSILILQLTCSSRALHLYKSIRQIAARYIQAVTYGDYRKVDNVLLPFAYSQTLNGQRQWALRLTMFS